MTTRKLLLLASAAACIAAGPALAENTYAQQAARAYANTAAEPKADTGKKANRKSADKNNKSTGKTASKKDAGKTVATRKAAPSDDAAPKKQTLFSTLFGGPIEEREQAGSKQKAASEKGNVRQAAARRSEKIDLSVLDDGRPVELRSDVRQTSVFGGLFGASQPRMLPETERRDTLLRQIEAQKGKKYSVKADMMPTEVAYDGNYKRGTIVVNTAEHRLYLIEGGGKARRYAIAVGKEGLEFKGSGKVGDKQEWPRWIPTKAMQQREPKKYGQYKDGMDGGPNNPLGARAIYLYQGKQDTHIRIHGTNQPWTIGTNSSNGCFRMVNEHVMDLYNRVSMGADIVVI